MIFDRSEGGRGYRVGVGAHENVLVKSSGVVLLKFLKLKKGIMLKNRLFSPEAVFREPQKSNMHDGNKFTSFLEMRIELDFVV